MTDFRVEIDTLGEVKVPRGAYYGAQTQRAVANFPISGVRLQRPFIHAQAVIKRAAAKANMDAGALDKRIGGALVRAAEEVMVGRFADQFVVDVFQAGAGTSQNMNMNEVLANRAEELLGGKLGEYKLVHPNDHANMSQSTNDTVHAAIHIAALSEVRGKLLPAMARLEVELSNKAVSFDRVIKCGRTHLQDAVPIRLGQVFGAYEAMIGKDNRRIERALEGVRELGIGGTAVGTGLNTPPRYRERVIHYINEATGQDFRSATNLFEAMQSMDAVVELSGALRVLATSLKKIADDIRLLGSGPSTGFGELRLPAVQPGSSIMPGKVNPVMAEMLNMVCSQAMGCDAAIEHAAQAGQLELNVMMPVIAYNLLLELEVLSSGTDAFGERCVRGIEADEGTCYLYAERSPSLATALSPVLGYRLTAELAGEALEKGRSIRELAAEKKLLGESELEKLLDLQRMTENPDNLHEAEGPSQRGRQNRRSQAGLKKRSRKKGK